MSSIRFCDERLTLDSQGVLLWPARQLMAVADLHLEKGTACANRGQLVPPWDSHLTLTRLATLVRRHAPKTLVSVGDSFHDTTAAARLSAEDAATLSAITTATRMIWVRGNHDPAPPAGIAGECLPFYSEGPLTFRHQAEPGAAGEISGHFHPKARVATRAGEITRPCFMCDDDKIMLPSFGTYTGGLEIGSPAITRHFPAGGRAFLLGRARLFCFTIPAPEEPRAPAPCNPAPTTLARTVRAHKSS